MSVGIINMQIALSQELIDILDYYPRLMNGVGMKISIERFIGETGYLIPINGRIDRVVEKIAESVFEEDVVYSSLENRPWLRPKLKLRRTSSAFVQFLYSNLENENEAIHELIVTIAPVKMDDFKPFCSSVFRVFKRNAWPLDADWMY